MSSRRYHLAQINVGRTIAPLDFPRMGDFVEQLPIVNALADKSPGFVWRLQDASAVQALDDPLLLINISVWESIESLQQFTYFSRNHLGALRNRSQWFERHGAPHLALWWVPAGHIPSVAEAMERLQCRGRKAKRPSRRRKSQLLTPGPPH